MDPASLMVVLQAYQNPCLNFFFIYHGFVIIQANPIPAQRQQVWVIFQYIARIGRRIITSFLPSPPTTKQA